MALYAACIKKQLMISNVIVIPGVNSVSTPVSLVVDDFGTQE